MRAKHHSSVALIAILSLWVSAAYGGSLPPGVVRHTNGVYLVENHSSAGMLWHRTGQRGATVVHLDAHDDCRFVAADKLERLDRLWKAKARDEIFRLSDLSFVSGFKVRPEDTLFDLGAGGLVCERLQGDHADAFRQDAAPGQTIPAALQ